MLIEWTSTFAYLNEILVDKDDIDLIYASLSFHSYNGENDKEKTTIWYTSKDEYAHEVSRKQAAWAATNYRETRERAIAFKNF